MISYDIIGYDIISYHIISYHIRSGPPMPAPACYSYIWIDSSLGDLDKTPLDHYLVPNVGRFLPITGRGVPPSLRIDTGTSKFLTRGQHGSQHALNPQLQGLNQPHQPLKLCQPVLHLGSIP